MDEFIVIICTVPSRETAMLIAEELVGTRQAACVNIIPQVTSIYHWKGTVHHDDELILMIKTRKVMFDMIRDKIMTLHPYEVPEIISFDIANGSESYLKWIKESTSAEK